MNYCIHTHIVRQVDVRVNKRIIPDADPRHDTDLDTVRQLSPIKAPSLSRPVSTSESPILTLMFLVSKRQLAVVVPAPNEQCAPDDGITGITHVKLSAIPDI